MPTPATDKVLATYELLEAILLHLPAKQLFASQRVSTAWKDLIAQSKGIRQICYLEPRPAPIQPKPLEPSDISLVYDCDLQVNSLLSSWVPGPKLFLPCSQGKTALKFQIKDVPCNTDSRREQFLTQPPCTEIYAWIIFKNGRLSSTQTCFSAYDKHGVKLGRLLDALEAAKNEELALIQARAERHREKEGKDSVEITVESLAKFEEAHALLVIESTTK